ncbi:hypothetical protein M405DRAFT_808260 [Rhizopogon salebrosus TDB-379]|nr:hypothetical protein M405DRAFT_808260 [Rhizopogon salebrosus TDB-379]
MSCDCGSTAYAGSHSSQREPNGRVSFASNFTHMVHCISNKRAASFTVFGENFMNISKAGMSC